MTEPHGSVGRVHFEALADYPRRQSAPRNFLEHVDLVEPHRLGAAVERGRGQPLADEEIE
jgi:hypothetical protein